MPESDLRRMAAGMGLSLADGCWDRVGTLIELWRFYGRSMSLTGSLDREALIAHIGESLQAVALVSRAEVAGTWLDIGSGAGFPGLIAAACGELAVMCVEPRAKRAAFLELASTKIGRPDVRVLRGRIEGGAWRGEGPGPEQADVVSARAVFAPAHWVEEARAWTKPGGIVLVHLGLHDPDPNNQTPSDREDGPRWSLRSYRRST